MATASAPVLAGTTLPIPRRFRATQTFRGGMSEKADGTVVVDLVQASAKHVFVLEWELIDSTGVAAIKTAYAAIASSSASFTDIEGNSYTVTRDLGASDLEHVETVVLGGGTLAYSYRLTLREA